MFAARKNFHLKTHKIHWQKPKTLHRQKNPLDSGGVMILVQNNFLLRRNFFYYLGLATLTFYGR